MPSKIFTEFRDSILYYFQKNRHCDNLAYAPVRHECDRWLDSMVRVAQGFAIAQVRLPIYTTHTHTCLFPQHVGWKSRMRFLFLGTQSGRLAMVARMRVSPPTQGAVSRMYRRRCTMTPDTLALAATDPRLLVECRLKEHVAVLRARRKIRKADRLQRAVADCYTAMRPLAVTADNTHGTDIDANNAKGPEPQTDEAKIVMCSDLFRGEGGQISLWRGQPAMLSIDIATPVDG